MCRKQKALIAPSTALLSSTASGAIVGLIITQFNDIHNKSLPVILALCIQGMLYSTVYILL